MRPRRTGGRAWGDVASLGNTALGGIAMMYVLDGSQQGYHIASALFFLILALDGVDGPLARRTRQSPMGSYLDSVSDGMGFVLLPCILLYSMFYVKGISGLVYAPNAVMVIVSILYISTGFYRLARFATMPAANVFRGAPVSLPATLVVSLLGLGAALETVASALVLFIPLMLMTLPFPKIKRQLIAPAAAAVLAGAAAFMLLAADPERFEFVARTLLLVPLTSAAFYSLSPLQAVFHRSAKPVPGRQKVLNPGVVGGQHGKGRRCGKRRPRK